MLLGYFSSLVWRLQVFGDKSIHPILLWVTGFVLPWTHQESGFGSRSVVRSPFAQLDTYTFSLTLILSSDKVQD
ncbi:hypothetical protein Hanom_Chr09g00848781 [Helianthus anomalus]